jgi:hypothetical protein
MLHCNMNPASTLQLGLEDLLADLHHARRIGDLGRLALVAYCEVRRWARTAGRPALAEHAAAMITDTPHASRDAFLQQIDALIAELEQLQRVSSATAATGAPDQSPSSTAPRLALQALRENLASTPRV